MSNSNRYITNPEELVLGLQIEIISDIEKSDQSKFKRLATITEIQVIKGNCVAFYIDYGINFITYSDEEFIFEDFCGNISSDGVKSKIQIKRWLSWKLIKPSRIQSYMIGRTVNYVRKNIHHLGKIIGYRPKSIAGSQVTDIDVIIHLDYPVMVTNEEEDNYFSYLILSQNADEFVTFKKSLEGNPVEEFNSGNWLYIKDNI